MNITKEFDECWIDPKVAEDICNKFCNHIEDKDIQIAIQNGTITLKEGLELIKYYNNDS